MGTGDSGSQKPPGLGGIGLFLLRWLGRLLPNERDGEQSVERLVRKAPVELFRGREAVADGVPDVLSPFVGKECLQIEPDVLSQGLLDRGFPQNVVEVL